MITAKVIRKSQNDAWLNHDLEYGKTYEVVDIDMGQSFTSIYLKDMRNVQTGVLRPYNSVIFEFYEDGMPLDIYRDTRFNSYIWEGKRAMTKDEIKKALECCEKYAYCKDCPCYTYCEHELHKGALALITEQEKSIQVAQDSILSLAQQNQEYREQQVKQAKIDVLNKVKNCREATDSDCYPYLERIVNKLIKEIENEQKD